jgi:hypothetical protein
MAGCPGNGPETETAVAPKGQLKVSGLGAYTGKYIHAYTGGASGLEILSVEPEGESFKIRFLIEADSINLPMRDMANYHGEGDFPALYAGNGTTALRLEIFPDTSSNDPVFHREYTAITFTGGSKEIALDNGGTDVPAGNITFSGVITVNPTNFNFDDYRMHITGYNNQEANSGSDQLGGGGRSSNLNDLNGPWNFETKKEGIWRDMTKVWFGVVIRQKSGDNAPQIRTPTNVSVTVDGTDILDSYPNIDLGTVQLTVGAQ